MSEFKPGEIALLVMQGPPIEEQRPGFFEEHDGQECEVMSGLVRRRDGVYRYPVRFSDGWEAYLAPKHLRKRRPPEQPADEDFQRDLNRWLKRDREVVV